MLLVAGVDTFGGIARFEIPTGFQSGQFFQQWHTVFLRTARIDGGFVHHIIAFGKYTAYQAGGTQQSRQIRTVMTVDRRRHGNNIKGSLFQSLCRGSKHNILPLESLRFQLACRINSLSQLLQPPLVYVEANHPQSAGKGNRQRQPDISQPDNCRRLLLTYQLCIHEVNR
ncbi:hypothetical protein Barb7_02093 [Bacteroidales bacterium Barb7]|nr:hypothetical protein Barb7_02093 [Bacteroidales bacterium Barb7]